ncbi:MAG: hypothetical protein F4151_07145 [Gammaproteobacteria bacterium]|nr:hypothetical protein [Gammaproteobacteria bacterium]
MVVDSDEVPLHEPQCGQLGVDLACLMAIGSTAVSGQTSRASRQGAHGHQVETLGARFSYCWATGERLRRRAP